MKQSSSLIPVSEFHECSFSCILPTTYGVLFLHPLGLIVSYRVWLCLERGRILLDKGKGLSFLPGLQPTLDTILHIAADLWLVWQGLGSSICIFATHALPLSTTLFREQLEHVGLAMCSALAALPIMAFLTINKHHITHSKREYPLVRNDQGQTLDLPMNSISAFIIPQLAGYNPKWRKTFI